MLQEWCEEHDDGERLMLKRMPDRTRKHNADQKEENVNSGFHSKETFQQAS